MPWAWESPAPAEVVTGALPGAPLAAPLPTAALWHQGA